MVNISKLPTVGFILLFVLPLIVTNLEGAVIKSVDFNKNSLLVKHGETTSKDPLAIENKAASEVLGITDPALASASDMAEFLLSIVANVLTIWGFGQQQDSNRQAAIDKETQETQTSELVGKWNSTLDGLNSRMDDIKRSLRELNCRLDAPQAIKTKGVVSQECLQFVQPLVSPSTRILLTPKQTSLLKKTDILSTSTALRRSAQKLNTPQYWLGLRK